ncbi:MAG: hypothetical protein IPO04_01445 [Cytophagaceae bacterium]|nr:hypothetical protein [Cytophagaceae bacterium]
MVLNRSNCKEYHHNLYATYTENNTSNLFKVQFEDKQVKLQKITLPYGKTINFFESNSLISGFSSQIFDIQDTTILEIKHDYQYWAYQNNYQDENFGFKIGYSPFTGVGNWPLTYIIDRSDSTYFNISYNFNTMQYANLKLNLFQKFNYIKKINTINNEFLYQLTDLASSQKSEFLIIDKTTELPELECLSIIKKLNPTEYLVMDNNQNFGVFNIDNFTFKTTLENTVYEIKYFYQNNIINYYDQAKLYPVNDKFLLTYQNSSVLINKTKYTDSLDFNVISSNYSTKGTYFDGKQAREIKSDKEYSITENRFLGLNEYVFAGKIGNQLKFINQKNQLETNIYQENGSNKSPSTIYFFDENVIAVIQGYDLRINQDQIQNNFNLNDYGQITCIDYDSENHQIYIVSRK